MSDSSVSLTHPWRQDLIGNIGSVTVGGTPRTSVEKYWDGDVPWMVSGDVHLTKVTDVPGRITELGLKSSNATMVDPPAVAVGLAGQGRTRGTVALVLCKLCTNQSVALIRADSTMIDPAYLLYNLQLRYEELRSRSAGDGRAGLSKQLIEQIPIPLPDISEQTEIAMILSTVDRAVEQTEASLAKQQHIKTGLMQDLLTRGIDVHRKIRSEHTHAFKDSPLGRIPKEWNVKRLAEAGEVCNSFRKPISALDREKMQGDYPYYGPTGVLDYINEFRVEGRFVLIGEDGDHFLKFNRQDMTILIDGKCNVNNHAHILRGRNGVRTEWLHLFFLHRDITLNLTRQGAGRFKLNKASLLELLLAVPADVAEQDRILQVMDTIRQSQERDADNLRKLRLEKTALMQDLLTGKKRVTPLLEPEIQLTKQAS
jgi:type I restriction enzyme S subunit